MTYPAAHNYLTVHFIPTGNPEEAGQFGLRFAGTFPAAGAEVTEAAKVSTWWTTALAGMPSSYALSFIKIARIMTNGEYDPAVAPLVFNYSPAPAGGSTAGATLPLQASWCVRLKTGLLSGLAHQGRIYLPPIGQLLNGNHVWTVANVNSALNPLSAMLSDLNGGPLGTLQVMSKGNVAIPGGAAHNVTAIDADTRPDVQRRRARSQVSTRSTEWVVSP
jgi:hypothetical protein